MPLITFNAIYNLNLQIRIIDFLLLAIVWFSYFKQKRLHLKSGLYFKIFLSLVSIYLFFDTATVYCVFHISDVPDLLTKHYHQLFLIFICLSMASYSLYIHSMDFHKFRTTLTLKLIIIIALVTCSIGILILPIRYYLGPDGAYSFGPMVEFAYGGVVIFYLISLINILYSKKNWSKEKFLNILIGNILWGIIAIIQITRPTLLISGIGLILMCMMNYLSFEDPKSYVNSENNLFNDVAFRKMFSENCLNDKPFVIWQISFKEFNLIHNRYGHEICLKIIKSISKILETELKTDIFSIDESTLSVLLPNTSNLSELQERMISKLEFDWKNNETLIHITCQIFQVIYKINCSTEMEAENIFAFMKTTNLSERLFVADKELLEKKERHLKIIELLEDAISNDGFNLFYQPIFSTKENNFHSSEALIRLKDTKTLGYISPEEFIPIAEKEGLIMQIGKTVLDKLCSFAEKNDLISLGVKYIEVNLSGIQCIDKALPKIIQNVIEKHNINASFLNLEITETAAVESGKMLTQNMDTLISTGSSFSMDDFGTGYSNLAKMAELKYSIIKIDKSLIWYCYPEHREKIRFEKEDNIAELTDKSKAVLETVISLIQKQKMQIVAEGVETKEMAEMLISSGVDYLQGFYFSKPISETEYIEFLKNKNR